MDKLFNQNNKKPQRNRPYDDNKFRSCEELILNEQHTFTNHSR